MSYLLDGMAGSLAGVTHGLLHRPLELRLMYPLNLFVKVTGLDARMYHLSHEYNRP